MTEKMYRVEDIEMFPTLVQRVKNFLSPDQCKDICEFFWAHKKVFRPPDLLTNGISTWDMDSSSHKDITASIPSCSTFTQDMSEMINQYADRLGISLYFTDDIVTSWISIQNVGSVHRRHKHTGSHIAGVIYLHVDDNSNTITFFNQNEFQNYVPLKAPTRYNLEKQEFIPEVGTLYLFPAWLSHGSDETVNHTPNRTIFSFNTF